jgi:hypothetical protein
LNITLSGLTFQPREPHGTLAALISHVLCVELDGSGLSKESQIMIECIQKEDVVPICPHCGAAIHQLWFREVASFFGKRYICFCTACREVLGISHRKGFWMG